MKRKHFVLPLVLYLCMLLSMTIPAFATQSAAPVVNATVTPQPTGSLIITSALKAPEGFNQSKVFTFVIKDSLGQVVASPTITGQGSVTVNNLTIGETYTVTEEYPCEKGYGYKIEVSGATDKNDGKIRIGGLPQRVDFVTHYVSGKPGGVPKTGDDDVLPMLYSFAAMAGIGGIVLLSGKKRKEQAE